MTVTSDDFTADAEFVQGGQVAIRPLENLWCPKGNRSHRSKLVVGDFLLERSDSLVPREHVHEEMRTEHIATTASHQTASGALAMHPDMWTFEGDAAFGTGPAIKCRFANLPSSDEGSIANFGGRNRANWQILRVENGVQEGWTCNYATAEEALAVLQFEYPPLVSVLDDAW